MSTGSQRVYGKGYHDGQRDAQSGNRFGGCMRNCLMVVGAITLLFLCLGATQV